MICSPVRRTGEAPVDTVTRLDPTGITLASYKLGLQVSCLNHDFTAADGGTQYASTLTIGTALPWAQCGL